MDFIKLIDHIHNRPLSFLRSCDLRELESFLRGVQYVCFQEDQGSNLLSEFQNRWIPENYPSYTHDWADTLIKEAPEGLSPYALFFIEWDKFLASR